MQISECGNVIASQHTLIDFVQKIYINYKFSFKNVIHNLKFHLIHNQIITT